MVLFREEVIDLYSSKVTNIPMRVNVNLFPAAIYFSNAPLFSETDK